MVEPQAHIEWKCILVEFVVTVAGLCWPKFGRSRYSYKSIIDLAQFAVFELLPIFPFLHLRVKIKRALGNQSQNGTFQLVVG